MFPNCPPVTFYIPFYFHLQWNRYTCKLVSWLWPSSQATNVAWNSVACYWFNHILTLSQGKHPRPIRGCLRPQSQLYAYLTTLPTSNCCLPSVPDFLVLPLEKSMMDKGGSQEQGATKMQFSTQKYLSPFPGNPPLVTHFPSNPSGWKELAPLQSTLKTSKSYWKFASGGALATDFKLRLKWQCFARTNFEDFLETEGFFGTGAFGVLGF